MENNTTSKWASYSTDDLGNYLSDYHKEVYGFRPRYEGLYDDRQKMIDMLDMLDLDMETARQTFAGRERLREEGWYVEETDPELIQHAKWLAEERQRASDDRERDRQIREIQAKAGW